MNTLAATATLAGLTADAALRHLGMLIEDATTLRDLPASERAIALGATIDASAWPSAQRVDLFYLLSNAWANVRQLRPTSTGLGIAPRSFRNCSTSVVQLRRGVPHRRRVARTSSRTSAMR